MIRNIVKDGFFGVAIGDALGVPAEFKSREYLKLNPIADMISYGTHDQPAGTWSDDSSMTFCTAESLCNGYNPEDIAMNFVKWYSENLWTPHGEVFDIGLKTQEAIFRFNQQLKHNIKLTPIPNESADEWDNGNGSLMRILPLAYYLFDKSLEEKFKIINEVSSLTHAHIRSVIACFIYVEYAMNLIRLKDKIQAYNETQKIAGHFLYDGSINSAELKLFERILKSDISKLKENEISSSGYVLHSLEASLWCLLTKSNFKETLLASVNLGDDSDTTGAITGGLAGILYGYENIPEKWISKLARKDDITALSEVFFNKMIPFLTKK
jgi:ADP-ribosyl-[dinitrogen reductase] hydrolase